MTRGLWHDPRALPRDVLVALARTCGGTATSRAISDDGQWFLHGRSDDTIKVAGKRLGPAEVETVVVGHPAVLEAAAVGVPDEVKGEALWVFVVVRARRRRRRRAARRAARRASPSSSGRRSGPSAVRFTTRCRRPAAPRSCAAPIRAVATGDATRRPLRPRRSRPRSTRSRRRTDARAHRCARVVLRPLRAEDWDAWREVRIRCRDWLERWEPRPEPGSADPASTARRSAPAAARGSASGTSTPRTASACSSPTAASRARSASAACSGARSRWATSATGSTRRSPGHGYVPEGVVLLMRHAFEAL